MKNVICIDLTKYNNEKLAEICVELGKKYPNLTFNLASLIANKKEGYAKVYADSTTGEYIAFTTKKDKNKIVYTEKLSEMLKSVESVVFVKEPKAMTVDSILEKIGKYGIETLTPIEKNFLDNSN